MFGMCQRGDADGIVRWISNEFPERITVKAVDLFLGSLSPRRIQDMANRILVGLPGDRYADVRIVAHEWLMQSKDEIQAE